MFRIALFVSALAFAACTNPAADRQVFDQLLKHPESRSIGIAVPAGSEDRVFNCYSKKVENAGIRLSVVTATLRDFLQGKELEKLPEKEKTQATLQLLLAISSIAECQGGLPKTDR